MSTEESPLLAGQLQLNIDTQRSTPKLPSDHVYNRFNHEEKRVILAIVSLSGLVPMFVTGCFIPSIPQISKDLDSTPATVSLSISLTVFASSLGVMFWSTYSSLYGRRAAYLCGIPFTIVGSFAVATATNINSLLFWRSVQIAGCSSGFVLGAATIGDIYTIEERGTAMGSFFGAALFGLAIAPPVGGILAQYWSWRGFQASLGVCTFMQMLLLAFVFPETAHPGSRGIDQVQGPKWLCVRINPFRCLEYLQSPNIMAITLMHTFALLTDYTLSIPIAYTVAAKYGIKDEGLIGALFLPSGLGNFFGSWLGGRISDRVIQQAKEKNSGIWTPEDRLRGVWVGGLVLVPISIILSGFTTTYVDGMAGLIINLVCFFANGVGVDMVLTPIGAYSVDIMPSRGAEIMAAITAFRSVFIAPTSAFLIPSIETIGVATTDSISGILALFGYFLIWLTIRYGAQMRAYVDVGYPDFHAQVLDDDIVHEA